jgi:Tfp pilus assembly protein PilF
LGHPETARVALERALKIDPQNELAISQLAELKRGMNSSVGAALQRSPRN